MSNIWQLPPIKPTPANKGDHHNCHPSLEIYQIYITIAANSTSSNQPYYFNNQPLFDHTTIPVCRSCLLSYYLLLTIQYLLLAPASTHTHCSCLSSHYLLLTTHYLLLLLIAPAYYLATYYLLCGAMYCVVCRVVWCCVMLPNPKGLKHGNLSGATPNNTYPLDIFYQPPPSPFQPPSAWGPPSQKLTTDGFQILYQLDTVPLPQKAGAAQTDISYFEIYR